MSPNKVTHDNASQTDVAAAPEQVAGQSHADLGYIDVSPMVIDVAGSVRETLQRSPMWVRMSDGTMPFAGRASYLEQHWEGLRVLLSAVESLMGQSAGNAELAAMRDALRETTNRMGEALDRSHATARWRDHHVTMPSMLQFRRRVAEMNEASDVVSLSAHCAVRLAAVGACPVPSTGGMSIPRITVVNNEESEELFAEELSAALILMLSHGSDVCRAYQGHDHARTCATTAAMIRNALRA